MDASGRHGAILRRLDSTRTPGLHTRNGTPRAFTRVVVGGFQMLSAGDDNKCFPYKDDAHADWRFGVDCDVDGRGLVGMKPTATPPTRGVVRPISAISETA